jgi:hypothetical protein
LSIGDFSLVGTVFPDIDGKNANGMFGVLPTISSFAYDAMTFTVTLGLSAPLQSDVVNLVIASAGVTDASGNQLDGEWANGGDSFNSGNGVAGGNFSFRMLSLPGDVRDDFGMSGGRSVNAFDVQDVRDGQNGFVVTGVGAFLYNERADVDGNGVVNATDAQYVRDAQLASIAAFPAAAPASTGLRTPSSPTFTPSVWTPADDAVSVDVTSSSLVADAGIDGVEWLAGWQQPTLGASEQDATGAAYDQVLETASVRPQYRPVAARTSQSPSETDLGYCDQAVDAAVDELFDFLEDEVEALFV